MKINAIFMCLMALCLVSTVLGECKRIGSVCAKSEECRSRYCRGGRCILYPSIDDIAAGKRNPCNTVRCGSEKICVIQQVQCVKAPCPGLAQCVEPVC